MTIKYIITAKEWFDKVYGNSYFSCRIESTSDKNFLVKFPFQGGYGDHAQYEAVKYLQEKDLITSTTSLPSALPIHYTMIENCLKRDVVSWGES